MAIMTAKERFYNEKGLIAKGFSKPTARIERLKQVILDCMPVVESERAVLVTEAYKATEEFSPIMRRAKVFEHLMDNMHVTIRDDELIVGSLTEHPRSSELGVEYSCEWLEPEFETLATRSCDKFYISDENKKILHETFKYWHGKTLSERALSIMSEATLRAQDAGVFNVGNYLFAGVGHSVVYYERIMKEGFTAIVAEAEEHLKKLDRSEPESIAKAQFYEAEIIAFKAAIRFGHRYEKKALELAERENNPVRKAELLQIAKNLHQVPEFGARNFYEAMQSFWMVHTILRIETNGHSYSPGPFDRFAGPFYEADKDITPEFAQELIDNLFVKFNDSNKVRDDISAQAFAGYQLFEMVALGGQDEEGNDLTNAVSYMCLEAQAHIMMPSPSVAVRVSNKTPDDFFYRVCEVIRLGSGMPNIFNDELTIPALLNRGIPLKLARTWTPSGCVEPDIAHKYDGWHDAASFNTAKVLEITLHNGYVDGKLISFESGDPRTWTCVEDLWDAFHKQLGYFVDMMVEADNCVDKTHGDICPLPYQSGLIEGCMDKGKSVQEGGALYNWTGPQGCAMADVGDSIYCIDRFVFQEKKFTMAELMDAMDHNFGYPVPLGSSTGHDEWGRNMSCASGSCCGEGDMEAKIYEAVKAILGGNGAVSLADVRSKVAANDCAGGDDVAKYAAMRRTLMAAPGFGNDDDEIDAYTVRAARMYCEFVQTHRNPRGGRWQAGMYPVSANVLYGRDVSASPTGRLAKTPVADGVSPRAGYDTNGPTAAAMSVAKLPHILATNGTLYNQKFMPAALAGDTGLKNFAALIKAYDEHKGYHIQFNVVDRETLIDAQEHPENYKDLVVRVAGYSAHYVTLSKAVQDNIIARTEQTF